MQAYFEDIEQHIIDHLKRTSNRLLVAMAWFSNTKLANEIILLSKKEIHIEILVDDNKINRNALAIKELIKAQIDIQFIKNFATSISLMHNKFCVIDGEIIITGSYNWTNNAKQNNENIIVIEDSDEASFYSHEFRSIKNTREPKKDLHFEQPRYEELSRELISHFKNSLKEQVAEKSLTGGSLSEFRNKKIENQLISIYEDHNINLKKHLGTLSVYFDLIGEHGIEFREKATPSQLARARNNFRRSGTQSQKLVIEKLFDRIKYKSVQSLIDKYAVLLEQKYLGLRDQEQMQNSEIDRIIDILDFLFKERQQIAKRIGRILNN